MDPLHVTLRENEHDVLHLLAEAHRLLQSYPRVARAVIGAFVAEGRTYAATAAGRELEGRLMCSERVRRARLIWDAFELGRLADAASGFRPSFWIGTILAATARRDLEELLARLVILEAGERP